MSTQINTEIIERAVELADHLNQKVFYDALEMYVKASDLEAVYNLVNTMQSYERRRTHAK
jgi:hypothetical protein